MKSVLRIAAVAVSLLSPLSSATARVWTDSSGTHSTEAEFVRLEGDTVVLKKPDGTTISVPVTTLSEADRRFLQHPPVQPGQPRLFDAAQRKAYERLVEIVKQLAEAERSLNQQKTPLFYEGNPCLAPDTLLACSGDPSASAEASPGEKDARKTGGQGRTNRYMLAAETKFRLGQTEDGKKFMREAIATAPDAHGMEGYRVAGNILVRLGAMKELDELIPAVPAEGGTWAEHPARLRMFLCQTLLLEEQPELAQKMAEQIPLAYMVSQYRVLAFMSLAGYYQRHKDVHRAADAYETGMLTEVQSLPTPVVTDNLIRMINRLARLEAWSTIDDFLSKSAKEIPNRLRFHVAVLLLDRGRIDDAAKLAGTMREERVEHNEGNPCVILWLKLYAIFAARGDAAKQANAVKHAKEAARGLAKSGKKLHWTEITDGYESSITLLIGIADAQAAARDAKGAAETLSEAAERTRKGPPAPVGYQFGQGGSEEDVVGHRDEMLVALVRAFLRHGDRPAAEKAAADVQGEWKRNEAAEILKPSGPPSPTVPAPKTARFLREADADTMIHNLARTGDCDEALKVMAEFPKSRWMWEWAVTIGEGAAGVGDMESLFKAVSLAPEADRNDLAFLGVLCTAHGEKDAAAKLLRCAARRRSRRMRPPTVKNCRARKREPRRGAKIFRPPLGLRRSELQKS